MSRLVTTWQLIVALAGAILTTLLFSYIAYRVLERSNQARFATVDLTGIVAKHQEKAVRALASDEADAASKRTALEEASMFGKKLDETLIATATECRCVLLVKESVVASNLPDLTAVLMAKLVAK